MGDGIGGGTVDSYQVVAGGTGGGDYLIVFFTFAFAFCYLMSSLSFFFFKGLKHYCHCVCFCVYCLFSLSLIPLIRNY